MLKFRVRPPQITAEMFYPVFSYFIKSFIYLREQMPSGQSFSALFAENAFSPATCRTVPSAISSAPIKTNFTKSSLVLIPAVSPNTNKIPACRFGSMLDVYQPSLFQAASRYVHDCLKMRLEFLSTPLTHTVSAPGFCRSDPNNSAINA